MIFYAPKYDGLYRFVEQISVTKDTQLSLKLKKTLTSPDVTAQQNV